MRQNRMIAIAAILLVVAVLFAGCNAAIETVEVSPLGWRIQAQGAPAAEVYEILAVGDLEMPTYYDCADAAGTPQPAPECSLGLVFVASPDYGNDKATDYAEHVQAIILDVFAAENPLNRASNYGQRLRPFQFYATEYRYKEATPGSGLCNASLPPEWAPASSNGRDVNAPAWDCNLALSTAATELDLGFIMHKRDLPDLNRYNLFSSEYNSYAAIVHELSHATFALSDEAPSTVQGGLFFPRDYANVYTDRLSCEAACAGYQSTCTDIPRLNADGSIAPGVRSGFYRCSTSPAEDAVNIMYFFPQPDPGDNQSWDLYDYVNAASDRLRHIYHEWCSQGRC